MKKSKSGFTIVELLIVIVVIAILAAISVVAYNGIQSRGRDSKRSAEMQSIEKALALYFVDNGGYPTCGNATYIPGGSGGGGGCGVSTLAPSLVPKYMNVVPTDPKNTGNDIYQYAIGYKKTGSNTFVGDNSNNYITGMRLETVSGNINSGWVTPNYYNYIGGSAN